MSTTIVKSTIKSSSVSDMIKTAKKTPTRISDLVKKGKKSNLRITLGSDPELFAQRVSDGKIVSSIPILKKDKHNPIEVGNGIKMYADNALVECSFPPSTSKKEMMGRIKDVLLRMQKQLGKDYRLLPQAAHTFGKNDLETLHGISPFEVGCSPSYDAHLESMSLPEPFTDNMRSGSFHIHIGNRDWKKRKNGKIMSFDSRHQVIKLLDIFLGLSSVVFDKDPTSIVRRKKYGTASNFRPTPYGVEYRTLSNYALRSPKLTDLVFDLVEHSLTFVRNNTELDVINSVDFEKVRHAINTCDVKLATQILKQVELPKELMARVQADYGKLDMYKEWGI